MQALHRLDTAFKLPDASIQLSESLHRWREEVELLFPYRTGKSATRKPTTDPKDILKDVVKVDTFSSEGQGPAFDKEDKTAPGHPFRLEARNARRQADVE